MDTVPFHHGSCESGTPGTEMEHFAAVSHKRSIVCRHRPKYLLIAINISLCVIFGGVLRSKGRICDAAEMQNETKMKRRRGKMKRK